MSNAYTQLHEHNSSSYSYTWMKKLEKNTTYYWRVKIRTAKDSSDWTDVWKFTTSDSIKFYSPFSNGVNLLPRSYFSWYRIAEYDSFEFQFDTVATFDSKALKSQPVKDTFSRFWVEAIVDDLRFSTTYYARVRGVDATSKSGWSETRFGHVLDTLRITSLSARGQTTMKLRWLYITRMGFQVQLDTTLDFNSPLLIDTTNFDGLDGINHTELEIDKLHYGKKYYLRLRGRGSYNDSSSWVYRAFETAKMSDRWVTVTGYGPNLSITAYNLRYSKGYRVQIDTTDQFNSPLLRTVDSTTTRVFFEKLRYGQTYFARAKAFHEEDTSDWCRVRTLNTYSQVSIYDPRNNATNVGIRDSFRWGISYPGTTHYQFQLSKDSNYSTLLVDSIKPQPASGWFDVMRGIELSFNTEYYWRVRMWHEYDTSVWSFFPKGVRFTTVEKPVQLRPWNSLVLTAEAEPEFRWEALNNIPNYRVHIDTSINFDSPELIEVTTDTNSITVPDLLFRPVYYWRVQAIAGNDTSLWSDTWNFSVRNPPFLSRPKNNSTGVTVDMNSLDWNSITGTDGYIVQMDTNDDFSTAEVFTDEAENNFFHYFHNSYPFKYNKKYYWRVKVYHKRDTSDWSAIWNFTTQERRAPDLIYPAEDAVDVPVGFTFRWNAYPGAAAYLIQYSEKEDLSNGSQFVVTGTSRTVAVKPNTTYYWRVRSRNSSGQEIWDWSETWSFVSQEKIDIPTLESPVDGLKNADLTQTLRWESISGANFDVELDDNSSFSSPAKGSTPSSYRTFGGLKGNTTYYWRVRAKNAFTVGEWSDVWSFETDHNSSVENLAKGIVGFYPNPVKSWLHLKLDEHVTFNFYEIQAITSATVQSGTVSSKEEDINVSKLSNGVYVLLLHSTEGVVRQKFVVER